MNWGKLSQERGNHPKYGCTKVWGGMEYGILKLVEREWGGLLLTKRIPAKNVWGVLLVTLNALIILRETWCYDIKNLVFSMTILSRTVVSNILATVLVNKVSLVVFNCSIATWGCWLQYWMAQI